MKRKLVVLIDGENTHKIAVKMYFQLITRTSHELIAELSMVLRRRSRRTRETGATFFHSFGRFPISPRLGVASSFHSVFGCGSIKVVRRRRRLVWTGKTWIQRNFSRSMLSSFFFLHIFNSTLISLISHFIFIYMFSVQRPTIVYNSHSSSYYTTT